METLARSCLLFVSGCTSNDPTILALCAAAVLLAGTTRRTTLSVLVSKWKVLLTILALGLSAL
ncbi:MAG TPA: hypothetical protein VFV34_24610, partial [Blastocatellia bacterium]|nr:hypothetical protein [Blastocatellia bacterium]